MFGPKHDLELIQREYAKFPPTEESEIRALIAIDYFVTRVLFHPVNSEVTIQGCSFTPRGAMVLLVVKATIEGTQQVAFVTEADTTRCIVSFCRQWLEGRVKWNKDKYSKD